MLTVAIPTYNRNAILDKNLRLLLPQLTEQCALLVLDNASPTPVEETLRPLLDEFPDVKVRLVRNVANIGANANILRCIELCETPWVWILGDDDPVLPDAIETMLRALPEHPDCVLVNFAIDDEREREWETRGLEELAQTLDASADLPWISTSVYNTAACKPQLKFGYQYMYSLFPHIAILLMAVGKTGTCYFSKSHNLNAAVRDLDMPIAQQWSSINLALGYPVLFDMPSPPELRRQLATRLTRTNLRPGNGLRNVAFELLLLSVRGHQSENALHYFEQIRQRQWFSFSRRAKWEARLYWLLLRFPRLGARIYRLTKGRALGSVAGQDRYDRM